MAQTPVAPNNKAISFGTKPEREIAGHKISGAAKKSSIRKTAKRAMKRGMISPKAAAKHLGEF